VQELVKKFTLHDRVPCCFPEIMQRLVKDRAFATLESLKDGTFYEVAPEKTLA